MSMKRVLVVPHPSRADAADLARQTATFLRSNNAICVMTERDAALLAFDNSIEPLQDQTLDLVVTLGGDGTVLRAIQLLGGQMTPLLAVNVGILGYLTEVEPHELFLALGKWLAGEIIAVDERMLLSVEYTCSGKSFKLLALNEVVVEKREPGHTVRLHVAIDGEPFTSFAADGLIVATPTGSTAYAFSARGPIMSPRHRAILMTPVSPHMLFDRSLVLAPDEDIVITVMSDRPVDLAVDGRAFATLAKGDTVKCTSAQATARFLQFEPRRFHQILKAKFGLADKLGGRGFAE